MLNFEVDKSFFGFDSDLINKYSKIATFLHWSLEELHEDIIVKIKVNKKIKIKLKKITQGKSGISKINIDK